MPRYFALVPAAGAGARMGAAMPKQYLALAGRPLLHHALRALAGHPRIERVFVVLAPGDSALRRRAPGATSRAQDRSRSTAAARRARRACYNGLLAARDAIGADDWVLVHDAARPCLSAAALDRLMREVGDDEAGGLLAIPVADTLKRADGDARVARTEPREDLWQAQTPQMFRYGCWSRRCARAGPPTSPTRRARSSACGLKPKLVMGEARNIKVTYPEDLALAESILRVGERRCA